MRRPRRGYCKDVPARVTIVGSLNLDHSFAVAALPAAGETVLASATASAPGGKGGNQAIAAARAGADVQMVAALGDDHAAARLRAHLSDNAVGLDGVVTLPGDSGTAVIVVDADAENTIVVAPGVNAHLTVTSPRVQTVIADADVVLIQLEIPLNTALAAARIGRESGAVVIVNASPMSSDPVLGDLAATTDVVVVNDSESHRWHWPIPHLVTTRGADGARYAHAGHDVDVPAPAVEPVDTTGAGDVFAGVLAAEWSSGPERALRRACAAGALATLVPGAGDCAPRAEAIDDVLANTTPGGS